MASADNPLAPFSITTLSHSVDALSHTGSAYSAIVIEIFVEFYRSLSLPVLKPTRTVKQNPKSCWRIAAYRCSPQFHWNGWRGDYQDCVNDLDLLSMCFSHRNLFRRAGVVRSAHIEEQLNSYLNDNSLQPQRSRLRKIQQGWDEVFSQSHFINVFNVDLANDLGTLLNRTLKTASRYCGVDTEDISSDASTNGQRAYSQIQRGNFQHP